MSSTQAFAIVASTVAAVTALFTLGTQAQPAQIKVAMTDSTASTLVGVKRAVISSVTLSFQASVAERTSTQGIFANKTDASATLQMPEVDMALLASIADEIYDQLKTDLQSNGFELVPEATLLTSANYKNILRTSGITNYAKYANLNGDIWLVGATALKPYLPYAAEAGKFVQPAKSHIKGWLSGMTRGSSTEGGPTYASTGNYELPAMEVALAKELGAHVVKATYVVTLGAAAANTAHGGTRMEYSGKAKAQAGMAAGQSRIAFRSPSANAKGESASTHYAANFGDNAPPAKDGDVVVALASTIAGGASFFSIVEPETRSGLLIGGLLSGFGSGADKQFIFTATVNDAASYRADVLGMLKAAQRDMLGMVKQ